MNEHPDDIIEPPPVDIDREFDALLHDVLSAKALSLFGLAHGTFSDISAANTDLRNAEIVIARIRRELCARESEVLGI